MPPSPIPAPLPPWARALLQLAPFINAALQEALQYFGEMKAADHATPDYWRHVECVCEPNGAHDPRDAAVTTFDIVNITNGSIDSTWTDADYAAVLGPISNMLQQWCAHMRPSHKWSFIKFYRRAFNPIGTEPAFVKGGPPERIYPITYLGTSNAVQANQVSLTSTDMTAYRRHWGRNYWPFPSAAALAADGHITNTVVDDLASDVETQYLTLMNAEFFPVVPVTQVDGVPTRGLLTVNTVQVDNVPDVIRRRRPAVTTYRKAVPLEAFTKPAAETAAAAAAA